MQRLSAVKGLCDERTARLLKKAFSGRDGIECGVDPTAARKTAQRLLSDVDVLRGAGCRVGCRSVNTVASLLGRWGMPEEAERFQTAAGQPADHVTHLILMGAYSKKKRLDRVKALLAARLQAGFPLDVASCGYVIKALAPPAEQEALAVLRTMRERDVAPDAYVARFALRACATAAAAERMRRANFEAVLSEEEAAEGYLTLAARAGDRAEALRLLAACAGSSRGVGVAAANSALNAYATAGDLPGTLAFLRAAYALPKEMRRRSRTSPLRGERDESSPSQDFLDAETAARAAIQAALHPVGVAASAAAAAAAARTPNAVTVSTVLKACVAACETEGDVAFATAEQIFEDAFRLAERAAGDGSWVNGHAFTKMMELYAKAGARERAEELARFHASTGLRTTPPLQRYYEAAGGQPGLLTPLPKRRKADAFKAKTH